MRYVLQNQQSEDTIQLFDASDVPVPGVPFGNVQVHIRKNGDPGFTPKTIIAADWTDRGDGNYSLQFSSVEFDTLGLFRYQVISTILGVFVPYEDSLQVVDEIPSFPTDPPSINEQTDTPIGITPDPVYRGSSLFINGENLGGALSVTIGGVPVPIIANSNSQIEVTVVPAVSLGDDQQVVVTTAGGTDSALVSVVLNPVDIPGAGMVALYGFIYDPGTGNPVVGVGVNGRVLDMPNIEDGVGWTDKVVFVETDVNGRFDILMPREKRVEIEIPRIRYRRVFVTPDVVSANLFTEIP